MPVQDYPDYTSGITLIPSGSVLTATDYPDWTDGVVDITGAIVAGQDFPDWIKAIGQITIPASNPLAISGCQYWYDASQITGQSDNTALTNWLDLSGNGYTVTGSGATRPTYYKSTSAKLVNGLPAVWFTAASSQIMITAAGHSIIGTGGVYTSFAVGVPNSSQANGVLVSQQLTANFIPFHASVTLRAQTAARNTAGTGFVAQAGSLTIGQQFRQTAQVNTTPQVVCRSAGTAGTPTTITGTPETGSATWSVGSGGTGVNPFDGAICELFFYNTALTLAQIQSLELYLANKWGTP